MVPIGKNMDKEYILVTGSWWPEKLNDVYEIKPCEDSLIFNFSNT